MSDIINVRERDVVVTTPEDPELAAVAPKAQNPNQERASCVGCVPAGSVQHRWEKERVGWAINLVWRYCTRQQLPAVAFRAVGT